MSLVDMWGGTGGTQGSWMILEGENPWAGRAENFTTVVHVGAGTLVQLT